MNAPTSLREAIVVQALGDLVTLTDRVEALTVSMDAKRLALIDASAQLQGRVQALETGIAFFAQQASVKAVEHIARRSNEAARQTLELQTRAMTEAARLAFSRQVDPALAKLAASLQRSDSQRPRHPWNFWLAHIATAASAVTLTCAVFVFLR